MEDIAAAMELLMLQKREQVQQKLASLGVDVDQAAACSKLFGSAEEALLYIPG